MSELKPCPFCGSKSIAIQRGLTGTPRVWCADCRCNTGGKDTEAEAIEAWNKRHRETCTDTTNDADSFFCSNCGAEVDV